MGHLSMGVGPSRDRAFRRYRAECGEFVFRQRRDCPTRAKRKASLKASRRSPRNQHPAPRIRYSATAAPNREPAFRQICPRCQRHCSEYGEQSETGGRSFCRPTDPKINVCALRLSSPHKQLVEQNPVGNGGFSIRFRRRGLPRSGSSCCHLAKSAPSDNREPTIRRSASGLCAGGKYTRSLERRTAPLPAVPVRQIPIGAFACLPSEHV